MASNNDILRDYLSRVKSRLIDSQSGLFIRLSGTSAGSLKVERVRSQKTGRFEAGAILTSIDYFPTNFNRVGVQPGVFPPFGPGSKLERWVIQRGLTTTDKNGRLQSPAQTSFLVARKINAAGTRYHTRGGIPLKSILADEMEPTLKVLATDNAAAIIKQWNTAIIR